MEYPELIKKYGPQLEEYARALFSGDPAAGATAAARVEDLFSQFEGKERDFLEDYYSRIQANSISTVMYPEGGKNYEQLNKYLKTEAVSSGILAALKTGAGLWQIIDANSKLKKLSPPKMPQMLHKNPQLSSLIARQLSISEQGDVELKQEYKDQLAEARDVANERAKSSGSVGQYAGNIQAQAEGEREAIGEMSKDLDQRKRQDRRLAAGLIGQSMNEDRYIQDDFWKRFYAKNRAFEQSQRNLTNQLNTGVENAFVGLEEGARAWPRTAFALDNGEQAEQVEAGGVGYQGPRLFGKPMPPLTGKTEYGYDDTPFPFENDDNMGMGSGPPPMSQARFLMLANPARRRPQDILDFQNIVQQNFPGVAEEAGQWGPLTEEAYERLYDFDPMDNLTY